MTDLTDIRNFYAVTDMLGTSGMPTLAQFTKIAAAGYQTIINLARDDSPGQLVDEAEIVRSLGMEYVHIPVEWEHPQVEDVRCFFNTMDACQGQKLFVHCVANYRVAVFVYLYRSLRQSVSHEVAWADLTRLWTPEGVWADLILRVQDQA